MKQLVLSLSSIIKRAIDENTCKEEKCERCTIINAYNFSQRNIYIVYLQALYTTCNYK